MRSGPEEWARRILQNELGQTVEINDDGSAPGMYDLRIGPPTTPDAAIECIGAVDPRFAETWNIGPAEGPLQLSIKGDWTVTITATAPVKSIKQRIERLLRDLEAQTIYVVDHRLRWRDDAFFEELEALGITRASCYRLQGTGKVYLTMPGRGSMVDERGNAVPEWIGELLRDPRREDVVRKLERSGATECHVFVIVSFSGVPSSVECYLTGELKQLPSQAPNLPPPITGVWVVSELGPLDQKGLRWDGSAWKLFRARGEGIDR